MVVTDRQALRELEAAELHLANVGRYFGRDHPAREWLAEVLAQLGSLAALLADTDS